MEPRRGFTLLEVLVALLVISIGLLGLLGSLGPITALAGEGRAKGRAALALESRVDQLRSDILASPGCTPPPAGSDVGSDGVRLAWEASLAGGLVELRLEARAPVRGGTPDSVITRVACR